MGDKQKQFEEEFFGIVERDLLRRGIPKGCLYEGEWEALCFFYATKVMQAIDYEKAGLDLEESLIASFDELRRQRTMNGGV